MRGFGLPAIVDKMVQQQTFNERAAQRLKFLLQLPLSIRSGYEAFECGLALSLLPL